MGTYEVSEDDDHHFNIIDVVLGHPKPDHNAPNRYFTKQGKALRPVRKYGDPHKPHTIKKGISATHKAQKSGSK